MSFPNKSKKQGGIEAKLGGTVWIPLNGDSTAATANSNNAFMKADYTINDLQDLIPLLPSNTANPRKNSFRSKNNNARRCPYNRRVASLPDLENGNSNSSDGSWWVIHSYNSPKLPQLMAISSLSTAVPTTVISFNLVFPSNKFELMCIDGDKVVANKQWSISLRVAASTIATPKYNQIYQVCF